MENNGLNRRAGWESFACICAFSMVRHFPSARRCACMQAYEDDDRRVRKAGVDVLVKLYQRVGELLWTYIHNLSDAKVNILYTNNDASKQTSPTTLLRITCILTTSFTCSN